MPKFFNTISIKHSSLELKTIYEEYKKVAIENRDPIMSYSAFLKFPHIDTFVDMKCLNCHHQVREHFGDYAMEMEGMMLPFPIDWCPECEKQHLVPLDIYNKIIG
jgi:hypothetical protein